MTKTIDLKRADKVLVEGKWRKVSRVWVVMGEVVVGFANGDSIRWSSDFMVQAK